MIQIENLSFRYPGCEAPVLDNISLNIPKGSLFGLLGPNGAGKTTLISLLTGLLTYSNKTLSGPAGASTITIDGKPLASFRHAIKQITGYVPQDLAFYPNLTGLENLAFFAGAQGLPAARQKQRIEFCLQFCQLQSVAGQYAGRYSGGLKRRLNIAIGLLTDPQILYLDEPTVGIDPQSRAFILEQIKTLHREGKTIVYTSHYLEEVEQLCDHLAIIDHGKVLVQGDTAQLQEANRNLLIIDCPTPPPALTIARLRQEYKLDVSPSQLVFYHIDSTDACARLLALLASLNIETRQMNYGSIGLENLFLQLTDKALRD